MLTPPPTLTPSVAAALAQASDSEGACVSLDDRVAGLRQAFLACRTRVDLAYLLVALHRMPAHAAAASHEFERALVAEGAPLATHPALTDADVAAVLLPIVTSLATGMADAERRYYAMTTLRAAGACGLVRYDDPIGQAVRTAAMDAHAASVAPSAAGADPAAAAQRGGRTARETAYDMATFLAGLPTLTAAHVEDLLAHLDTWARGTERQLVWGTRATAAQFVTLLDRGQCDVLVYELARSAWALPTDRAAVSAVVRLLRRALVVTAAEAPRLLLRGLFETTDQERARCAFEVAAELAPDVAVEWLEQAPLYRLAKVERLTLEGLLRAEDAEVRGRAIRAMPRLERAVGRRPPQRRR